MRTAFVVVLLWASSVMATEPNGADTTPEPLDPIAQRIADLERDKALFEAQKAALEAKKQVLAAEKALLTERFGENPALPTGTITGENHLAGLTGALLIPPMKRAAATIVRAVSSSGSCPKRILITGDADRREQVTVAASIQHQASDLDAQLDDAVKYAQVIMAGGAGGAGLSSVDSILAPLGALESLMDLFAPTTLLGP